MIYGNLNLEYFTYAKMFYDVGIIGLIFYYLPFVLGIKRSFSLMKIDRGFGQISFIISARAIYWTFYGNIIEADVGVYLLYLLLAVAFLPTSKFININMQNNK
jgi:hypothetical protein